jgi:hypothetical protein
MGPPLRAPVVLFSLNLGDQDGKVKPGAKFFQKLTKIHIISVYENLVTSGKLAGPLLKKEGIIKKLIVSNS